MALMLGFGVSGSDHSFYAFDDTGKVWNGSAFVAWADADFASYRIAATEIGTTGEFTATLPADAVRWSMRFDGASLAASYLASVGEASASQASLDELAGDGDTIDGHTTIGALKLMLAAAAGKLSGASGTAIAIRAADDSKTRITATVDAYGNRSAVTLDDT